MSDYQERLWGLVHQAIDQCCVRELGSWTVSPEEAERKILATISPIGATLEPTAEERTEKGKTKEELLSELAVLAAQFKLLMKNLDSAPKEITISAIQLDVARYREKIKVLEWVLGLEGDETDCDDAVDKEIDETKRQLESVEKVTA